MIFVLKPNVSDNLIEYLITSGCYEVILCERGIRTFETATRNTLDISLDLLQFEDMMTDLKRRAAMDEKEI